MAPPFAEAEFSIMYNQGINREASILEAALTKEILNKKGAWIQYNGEMIGQGKEAARQYLVENPKVADEIRNKVLELVSPVASTSSDFSQESFEEPIED